MPLPSEIDDFYSARYDEARRLETFYFRLERARTEEILLRHLPAPPAVVLDVGGAAGAYSFWLAERGYAVHLIEPVARHLEQAREAAKSAPAALAGIHQGDARRLDRPEASADAVLMLGPLYHLTERNDRLRAISEARRVLRPGGVLCAAAISRFASYVDWLAGPFFDDPQFERLVEADLRDGQHRNDTGNAAYFTTAFFHRPEELSEELREAGLAAVEVLPVEGMGPHVRDFEGVWADPARRERLLRALRLVEREPWALDASPHLLAIARRPRAGRLEAEPA